MNQTTQEVTERKVKPRRRYRRWIAVIAAPAGKQKDWGESFAQGLYLESTPPPRGRNRVRFPNSSVKMARRLRIGPNPLLAVVAKPTPTFLSRQATPAAMACRIQQSSSAKNLVGRANQLQRPSESRSAHGSGRDLADATCSP